MKRKLFLIALLFFLLVLTCPAKTVELSSLNYSFDVPDGYSTNSTYIASRYQYFASHHPEDRIVMTVTSTPYSGKSFGTMSSAEIQKLGQSMKNEYKAYGINVVSCSKYYSNGITFLKIELSLPTGYQIQYATIRNGKMNGFTFTFKNTPSASDKEEVSTIAKSIRKM